ncbi:AmiS/UreI family transporter [Limnohabitans sp.]|jgi:hypothetical protein|uniref:AmiS/UreI family transporter n=1 Tax=Limnohabitans sp. TaxID=1907725 RepID=UPI0037C14AC3
MYEPLLLFYVGIVLTLNGLWMLEKIADQEILIINFLVGILFLRIANELAFSEAADEKSIQQATFSLMFAFTYMWVALNRLMNNNGRGLGWFSLMVAVTAQWVSIGMLASAGTDLWKIWSAVSWTAWALLWLLFFFLQVIQAPWARLTGWISIIQGVLTGWLPAMLLFKG